LFIEYDTLLPTSMVILWLLFILAIGTQFVAWYIVG